MYSLGLQLHDEQVYGPALVHNEYLVIFTAAAVVIVVVVVVVVVVFGSGWVSHLGVRSFSTSGCRLPPFLCSCKFSARLS